MSAALAGEQGSTKMSVSQFRVSIATSATHSECMNAEIGKRTNLWVPESVRSPLTEGRFLSCLPSSSRIQNAASISNELQTQVSCFDYVVALSLTNVRVECGRQLHWNGDAKSSVLDECTHLVVCAIHHYVLLHSIFS